MTVIIRAARVDDAAAMGRFGVDTWLAAHHGQVPEEVWIKRRDEWNAEESARNWARTLQAIADGAAPHDCIYLAIDDADGAVVGIAMGEPAGQAPWPNTGQVNIVYVHHTYQGRGLGRRLVQAVAGHQRALGMTALTIAVLTANAPARRFYEAIGGQIVGEAEFEDYGYLLPEIVYGWADILALIAGGTPDEDDLSASQRDDA
jgi:GNAT superfamily N-acetyltransferase